MEILNLVTKILVSLLGLLTAYNIVYIIIGLFTKTRGYEETEIKKKYAVIISARNEEKVIGNLLDSIHGQIYDKDLITTFVVADNCSDNTASISREKGAIVYERHDLSKARKGYALEFLFDNIEKDYKIDTFDGFIIFDADNVVDPNFVKEINKAMVSGAKIVTGYRNTKNISSNFISFAYGIHFCRSMMSMHRARHNLHTGTHIAGTGYCISSELLKDGWHFNSLTEDTQLTLTYTAKGEKIEFCEKAEFYDEQPTSFMTSWRQRLRWTKGRLGCFFKCSGGLIKGIFTRPWNRKWACFDMFGYIFPLALFSLILSALYPITSAIVGLVNGEALPVLGWLKTIGTSLLSTYLVAELQGILVVIRERRHIKCPIYKQIFYTILWPWFELINIPLYIACLFVKVKWKPIVHKDETTINDLVEIDNSENDKNVMGGVLTIYYSMIMKI